MSTEYNEYLRDHVAAVNKGLVWLSENIADINEIAISEAIDGVIMHDDSKYETAEYIPYDNYFYNEDKNDPEVKRAFDYAWLHHIHNNPHHWQYWVLINDDANEGTRALEMPLRYVYEMIADWWSFSWHQENLMEIFKWYDDHKKRIIFHKNTRKIVEHILDEIKAILTMQQKKEKNGIIIDDSEETTTVKLGEGEYLEHHGVQGQKWGKRNGPPYPLNKAAKGNLTKAYTQENLKNAEKKNLAMWGKTPESNCLYISGVSGSGKSTVALGLADRGDTVIHLDGYTEPDIYDGAESVQNKKFNKYLDDHVNNWQYIYMDKEHKKASQKEYWNKVDEFRDAIESYSREEFETGHKVITEGVQITNGWMFERKDALKAKPYIFLNTDLETAHSRAQERDSDT